MIERFGKIKTKYGPSIVCHLEDYKVHMPRRLVSKLNDRIIKDLNKSANLSLIYKRQKEERFPLIELKSN